MDPLQYDKLIDWDTEEPVTEAELEAFVRDHTRNLKDLKAWAERVKAGQEMLGCWDAPVSFDEFYNRLMAGEFDEEA